MDSVAALSAVDAQTFNPSTAELLQTCDGDKSAFIRQV